MNRPDRGRGPSAPLRTAAAILAGCLALVPAIPVTSDPAQAAAPPKPVLLYRVMPAYPPGAAKTGTEGVVEAEIAVDRAGRVGSVRIVSETPPDQGFAVAATTAMWQWRFQAGRPGMRRVVQRFSHPKPYTLAEWSALPPAPRPAVLKPPRYPSEARRLAVAGQVEFVVRIDADGLPARIEVMSERPLNRNFAWLAAASLETASWAPGHEGTYRLRIAFDPANPAPEPAIDAAHPPRDLGCNKIMRLSPSYPEAAEKAKKGGSLRLLMAIDGQGRVASMSCQDEKPAGLGFCDAAKADAETLQLVDATPGTYAETYLFEWDD